MKFVVERGAIADAFVALSVRRLSRATIPILQHVLVVAADSRLRLVAHDLNSCSEVTIPAEVERAGSMALPAIELGGLISAFAAGAQVRVDVDGASAKISSGRARYSLGALSPDDFPEPLRPHDPVTFNLTAAEVEWLFATPQSAASREVTRIYLNGICLRLDDAGQLTACATDAYRLVEVKINREIAGLPAIIIPREAIGHILDIAKKTDVEIQCGQNAFSIGACDRRYTTRLIDATFPTYEQIIPAPDGSCLKIDRDALLRALQRIDVISGERSVVRMQWDAEPQELSLKLDGNGSGEEIIECGCAEDTTEGVFAVPAAQLVATLQVLEAQSLNFYVHDASQAMLICDPTEPTFRALQMPVPWHRSGAKEAA